MLPLIAIGALALGIGAILIYRNNQNKGDEIIEKAENIGKSIIDEVKKA